MDYRADYTEWGREYGTVNIHGEEDCSERDAGESECNEYEYFCPECDGELEYDFFHDVDAEGEDVDSQNGKPAPVILNPTTNSESVDTITRPCPDCMNNISYLASDVEVECPHCGFSEKNSLFG